MRVSSVISSVTKGIGALTIVATTCVAGVLAYASFIAPYTGRRRDV